MSYFAIVRAAPADDFSVIECHLNVWSLAGLFKRRMFCLDVGLRLRAGKTEVFSIDIAVPMGTYGKEAHGLRDLHSQLLDTNIDKLIFGRNVEVVGDRPRLKYESSTLGPTELELIKLDVPNCKRNEEYSGHAFSYWSIHFTSPLRNDPDSYLRMRFKVQNLGRTWIWKKSGLAKNGALMDLRITDLRESYDDTGWTPSADMLVPIESLNLFAIVPSSLQLRAVSPPYYYMRLFEGRVWEKYLNRAVDRRRKEKLVIYQWRSPKDESISPANPFHAFIDLSEEFGLIRLGNHFRTALVILLFIFTASVIARSYSNHVGFLERFIQTLLSGRTITVTAVFAFLGSIVWLLFRNVERFQKVFKDIRNKFLLFEERHFRKRMQD